MVVAVPKLHKRPMKNQQSKIAALNDQFRKGNSRLGTWVVSAGIDALPAGPRQSLIQAVQSYDNFTEDNDPYGEHDFGIIHWEEAEYFWEIICYNKSLKQLAANPEDFLTTTRVLTLMKAEEYYATPIHAPVLQDQSVLS